MRTQELPVPFFPSRNSLAVVGGFLMLAALALAPSAGARTAPQSSDPSLAGLENALRQRVALRGPQTSRTERAQLSQALRNLTTYQGLAASFAAPDPGQLQRVLDDLGTLVTVAQHLQRAGSTDPGVVFHTEAIRETIDGLGLAVRQVALTSIPLLFLDENRKFVEQSVARADEQRGQALEIWVDDHGAGASLLIDSLPGQHDAALFGTQALMDEAMTFPVDVKPGEVTPPMDMSGAIEPFELGKPVRLDVQIAPITRPVPELTIAVRAMAMDQTFSSSGAMEPPKQAVIGVMTLQDVRPGSTLPEVTVEVPPFEDESLVTTEGLVPEFARGGAVDIDGDTAVVSTRIEVDPPSEMFQGAVTVHERFAGDVDAWEQTALLMMPEPFMGESDGGFGASVAVSGNTIVVGAPDHDAIAGGTTSGAAFVFERGGSGEWAFVRRIAPAVESPAGSADDRFGAALDIDGDWIVVGAPNYNYCRKPGCPDGSAFVFERNYGGPEAWGQTDDIDVDELLALHPTGQVRDLGSAVAIGGDLLIVGDPGSSQAFVFELGADGWSPAENGWLWEGLPASPTGALYGASVAVADSTLAVGAPGYGQGIPAGAGAVYVYERINDCDSVPGLVCYSLEKRLTASVPAAQASFGAAVALTKTGSPASQMLVVGSPRRDLPYAGPEGVRAGSVSLYVRGHAPGCPDPMPPPNGWGLLARRVSDLPSRNGFFGSSLAVSSRHSTLQELDGRVELVDVAPTLLVGEDSSFLVIGEDCDGDGLPDEEPTCPEPALVERRGAAHFFNGMDPIAAGPYQLAVEVDPGGRVIEMDGDDAEDNNFMIVETPMTVCVPSLEPNLAVTEVELVPVESSDTNGDGTVDEEDESTGYILATADGTQISRAGINVTVEMTGGFDGPIRDAQLTAFLRFQEQPQLMPVPARVWNPEAGEHNLDAFAVPDIVSGDALSLHMDVAFDGPMLEVMESDDFLVEVVVVVTSTAVDTDPEDNEARQADQHWTVLNLEGCIVPGGGLSRATTWGKRMGNDEFNAALAFDGSLDMVKRTLPEDPPHGITPDYPGQEYGAVASLDASLDFAVFGRSVDDVVAFNALVERDPLYMHPDIGQGYGFFDVSLEALGYTFYSAGPVDSFTLLEAETLPSGFKLVYACELVPDGEDPCSEPPPDALPVGFRFTKEFSKDKTYPDRKKKKCCLPSGSTVMLTEPECCSRQGFVVEDGSDGEEAEECAMHAPVFGPCRRLPRLGRTFLPFGLPLDVDAAAKGTLGVSLQANVLDDFTFDVTPFIGLGVQVEAKYPANTKIHAGLRGTVTLVRYDHIRRSGLGMTVVRDDPVDPGDPPLVAICGLQCFKITHRITTLQGKLDFFGVIPRVKWCRGSGPLALPFPCGLQPTRKTLTFFRWPPAGEWLIPGRSDCGANACPLWVTGMLPCATPPEPCSPSPCDVSSGELGADAPDHSAKFARNGTGPRDKRKE